LSVNKKVIILHADYLSKQALTTCKKVCFKAPGSLAGRGDSDETGRKVVTKSIKN